MYLIRQNRGFTLIELIVVVAILGMLYAVVMPKFSDVTGLKLKATARRVAGMIKYTYDDAIAKNKKMRLAFDFKGENDSIWVEEWVELSPMDVLKKDSDEEIDLDELTISEQEQLEKAPRGEYQPTESKLVSKLTLPDYVKIKGIYIMRDERMIDRDSEVEEGPSASIVFFPSGFTEDAVVYVADKKERVYSIKINPVTGEPKIMDSYVDPKTL